MNMDEKTLTEVEGEILQEWKRLWHNGSILGSRVDIGNAWEWEQFDNALEHGVTHEIECMRGWIKEKWGLDLALYQYGRGGATVAPHQWMRPVGGNDFGPFDGGKWDWTPTGLYSEENIRREMGQVLGVLRDINETCRAFCANLDEWWKREKEALDITPERIAKHDGATKRSRSYWVNEAGEEIDDA